MNLGCFYFHGSSWKMNRQEIYQKWATRFRDDKINLNDINLLNFNPSSLRDRNEILDLRNLSRLPHKMGFFYKQERNQQVIYFVAF